MSATIIDGKATAAAIRAEITEKAKPTWPPGAGRPDLPWSWWRKPGQRRLRAQQAARVRGGRVPLVQIDLPADIAQSELLDEITKLNADPAIDGILCQFPLPKGWTSSR